MPRFAILRHEGPQGLHWDLLLESGAAARTWALPQSPAPGMEAIARALADHRLLYLDYEGPIAGQRGSVTAWDRGTYVCRRQSETELAVELCGTRVRGLATLRQLPGMADQWQFAME
jgi:hypothetical protein